ncbi:MAG: hypothetical protein AAF985_00300 [Bacteroidota bacterium]
MKKSIFGLFLGLGMLCCLGMMQNDAKADVGLGVVIWYNWNNPPGNGGLNPLQGGGVTAGGVAVGGIGGYVAAGGLGGAAGGPLGAAAGAAGGAL